jgi:RNA polymerase sigma factor (sigma-70 family)
LNGPQDVEIAEQVRAGSREAEDALAVRFLPRIRAFLSARTQRPDFIEELTQETFLAALRALRDGRLRQAETLGAFIYGIARNQLAEALRRRSRDRTGPMPANQEPAAPEADAPPEWCETARQEMKALDPMDRQILWLLLVEGYHPEELTARLGLTADAIRQRKSRVLRRLAEKFTVRSQNRPVGRLPNSSRAE